MIKFYSILIIIILGVQKCSCNDGLAVSVAIDNQTKDNNNKNGEELFNIGKLQIETIESIREIKESDALSEECLPAKDVFVVPDPKDPPEEFKRCVEELAKTEGMKHPLIGKTVPEVIKYYGFKSETHRVTTKDGYILTLHRIPSPIENSTPVLLGHGFAGCADNWTFNGRDQSLAFLLADLGYDVWMINSRGTSYSLGHEWLNSSSTVDLEYWRFSWHEQGMFDLPAIIPHVQKSTERKKMFYVGHSQGTTQFMVGASTPPASEVVNEENIIAAFLLAAAGFFGQTISPIRVLEPIFLTRETAELAFVAFDGRIDTPAKLKEFFDLSLGEICSPSATLCGACDKAIFALFGYDAPLWNYTNTPNILDKFPNNLPFGNIIHFFQSITGCHFRQFDHGPERNQELYKSTIPPDYKLGDINIPTYMHYGKADNLLVRQDVKRTAGAFDKQVIKKFCEVPFDIFNHADFVIAKNVVELLYLDMLSDMWSLCPSWASDAQCSDDE